MTQPWNSETKNLWSYLPRVDDIEPAVCEKPNAREIVRRIVGENVCD